MRRCFVEIIYWRREKDLQGFESKSCTIGKKFFALNLIVTMAVKCLVYWFL